jgi:hypothetical protein
MSWIARWNPVSRRDVIANMKARAIAMLAVLALTAAYAPQTAQAASGPTMSYDLNVRTYDQLTAGEYDGRMRIRITPDGIVQGTFMNTQGQASSVTGGLDGTKIWLEIGNSSRIGRNYYSGTFMDGVIKAAAPTTTIRHLWMLEAKPAASTTPR